jgi:hypothetical protein
MICFEMLHPRMTHDMLGFLPYFLNHSDERPAKEQFNTNYAHGGGWRPMSGFKMMPGQALKYPGDPLLRPLARARFRNELILFYDCAIVAIVQPDGSFEASRMD